MAWQRSCRSSRSDRCETTPAELSDEFVPRSELLDSRGPNRRAHFCNLGIDEFLSNIQASAHHGASRSPRFL